MRARDGFSAAVIAVTAGFAGVAIGGATRWSTVGVSVLGLIAAAAYASSRRVATTRLPLIHLLLAALVLTVLQLVPLPVVFAEVLAAGKLSLVADNAAALDAAAPRFVLASYDPPATLVELVKFVGYTALALAALRLAARSSGRHVLAAIVCGVAVLVAITTLVHSAVGATKIYGLFTPPPNNPLVGPLMNPNHFASLMTLACPVGLALAFTSKGVMRGVWLAAAVLCAGSCLMSASRGGVVSLVIGVVTTVGLVIAQRRTSVSTKRANRGRVVQFAVIAACGVTLLVALTAGRVSDEISKTDVEVLVGSPGWKIQTWLHSLPMISDSPWLGTGRGAFQYAYTRFAPVADATFSHEENSFLQVVVDWGLAGGAVFAVCAGALAVAARRRWRESPLEAGALGALVALCAHEMVDFSLELPVVAIVSILLCAILVPPTVETVAGAQSIRRIRLSRAGLIVAGFVLCVFGATSIAKSARAEVAELATAGNRELPPEDQLQSVLRSSARHPSDYLLLGRAAQLMMDMGDRRSVAVLSRALFLNPRHIGLHRLAATMMVRLGQPSSATAELAIALELAEGRVMEDLLETVVATFPDPDSAVRALPLQPIKAVSISGLLARKHADLNLSYARRLALVYPSNPDMRLLFSRAALVASDVQTALDEAGAAYGLRPNVLESIAYATALRAAGNFKDAGIVLATALRSPVVDTSQERFDVLDALVQVHLASGDLSGAEAGLIELARIAGDTRSRVTIHLRRAVIHDRRGEPSQAKYQRDEGRRLQQGGL